MFDKPLFSRKQLHIIIVVTAVAIVLLASTGQPQPLPQVQQQQVAGISLYSLKNNAPQHRLRMSFALPEPYAAHQLDARLLQRALFTQIERRLQSPPFTQSDASLQLNLRDDRLTLDLTLTDLTELNSILPALLEQLQQPLDSSLLLDMQIELEARTYLERQQLSAAQKQMALWLTGSAQTELNLPSWHDFKSRLFSRSQLSLSLVSDAPQAALPALEQFQQLPAGQPWVTPYTGAPGPQSRDYQHGAHYIVQLGRYISGRQNATFARQQMALRLLQQSATAEGLSSHWQALAQQGSLEFSAYSAKAITAEVLLTSLTAHIQQLTEDELSTFTESLTDKLEQLLSQPDALLEQLDAIAFYQLPADYLQSFAASLEQLTPDQLRQDALNLLAAEDYFVVTERPLSP